MNTTNTQNKNIMKPYLLGGAAVLASLVVSAGLHASADETTNTNSNSTGTASAPTSGQVNVNVNHDSVDKATQDAQQAGVKVTTNTNTETVNADEADSAKKAIEENEAQQAQNVADTTKQQQANTDATNQANAQVDQANADSQKATTQANAQLQDAIQKARQAGISIDDNGTVHYSYDNSKYDSSNADTVKQSIQNAVTWLKQNTDTSVANTESQAKEIADTTARFTAAVEQLKNENQSLQAQKDALENLKNQAESAGITVTNDPSKAIKTADFDNAKSQIQGQIDTLQALITQHTNEVNQYNIAKTQFDKELADYEAHAKEMTTQKGNASQEITQQLLIGANNNSKVDVQAPQAVTNDSTFANSAFPYHYQDNANGVQTTWTTYRASDAGKRSFSGETFVATYTNLDNASYAGQKISKIVRTVQIPNAGDDASVDTIAFSNDPSMGLWADEAVTTPRQDSINTDVNVTDEFYDESGNKITIGDNAYIVASSLNNFNSKAEAPTTHREELSVANAQFIPINGSSITMHDDGFAYSDNLNSQFGDTSDNQNVDRSADSWDSQSNPNRYWGAGLFKLNPGQDKVSWTLRTYHNGDFVNWTAMDTANIPVTQRPKFNPPVVNSLSFSTGDVDYVRDITHPSLTLNASDTADYSIEHINKPADLSVNVTKTNLVANLSQPQKSVTIDAQDVNGKTLARGTKLQYTLANDTLPANRTDDVQSISDDDTLSDALTFNGWHAYQKQADGSLVDVTDEYQLTQTGQKLHWEAKPALLARYNQDKTQSANQAYIVLDTTVNSDDKVIQNTYDHSFDGKTTPSNTETNTSVKVTPHKSVLNSDGQNMNGMALEQGDDVHYAIDWDMTGFDQNMAYSKDQETTGLSVTDNYSDLFVPTKDKLSVFDGKGNDVTDDVDVTWGDNTVTVKAKNVKDFINKYGKSTLRINLIGIVKQNAQSGEMLNTALQNDFGDEHATETVTNKITPANPSKSALVNGQRIKNGDKVVLNTIFPYIIDAQARPANAGEPTKAWSLSDKFDAEYDQYLGQWTITTSHDITMPDGSVIKAGTVLNDYFGNQLADYFAVDYRDGTLCASMTDKMLNIINSDVNRKTEQGWFLSASVKRIKDGTAHNTAVERYNNRTTNTNTLETVTPKVHTQWMDENGKTLKPEVEGTFPGGDIPGYKFIQTVTDGDGNIINFYRALHTSWVDENGNALKPQEQGLFPGGDIPGYEFVRTDTDNDGNLINIYKKVVEPVVSPTATATAEPQAQAPVVPQSPMPATGKDTHSDNKALLGLAVASALALFGTTYRRQTA